MVKARSSPSSAADFVAIRVAVGHLGYTVAVRLALGGLDTPAGHPGDPVAEVVDERQDQGISRPFGLLHDFTCYTFLRVARSRPDGTR